MMGISRKSIYSLLLLAGALPACSTIKNYFPDKTKDYQYATELPPLQLPEHIKAEAKIQDRPVIAGSPYQTSAPIEDEQAGASPKAEEQETAKPLYYASGIDRIRCRRHET